MKFLAFISILWVIFWCQAHSNMTAWLNEGTGKLDVFVYSPARGKATIEIFRKDPSRVILLMTDTGIKDNEHYERSLPISTGNFVITADIESKSPVHLYRSINIKKSK